MYTHIRIPHRALLFFSLNPPMIQWQKARNMTGKTFEEFQNAIWCIKLQVNYTEYYLLGTQIIVDKNDKFLSYGLN